MSFFLPSTDSISWIHVFKFSTFPPSTTTAKLFVRHSIDVVQQTSSYSIMRTNYCSSAVAAAWVIKTDGMFEHYELGMN